MKKFFSEFLNRFKLKTPSFFQVIQTASIICGTIAGVPALLAQFQSELHIALPGWVLIISSRTVAISAAVAWVIAKLPVTLPVTKMEKEVLEQKLPFTEKNNS